MGPAPPLGGGGEVVPRLRKESGDAKATSDTTVVEQVHLNERSKSDFENSVHSTSNDKAASDAVVTKHTYLHDEPKSDSENSMKSPVNVPSPTLPIATNDATVVDRTYLNEESKLDSENSIDTIHNTGNVFELNSPAKEELREKRSETLLSKHRKPSVSTPPETTMSVLLDNYEKLLQKNTDELHVLRDVFLRKLQDNSRATHLCDAAEHEESVSTLRQAMQNLEKSSRGKPRIIKESTLPAESQARQARIKVWETTLDRTSHASKLRLLENELRGLEATTAAFRMLQSEDAAETGPFGGLVRAKNPNVNPAEESNVQPPEFEPVGENCIRVLVDPQLGAEAFFQINLVSAPRYHATSMQLPLEDELTRRGTIKAVVDSGAAWSAIDADVLQLLFPGTTIRACDRRFKDASGNLMNVIGHVPLYFYIGDLRLATTVYVFKGLGAAFLLGVNSLHAHQLGISTQRRVLFSEHPLASKNSQAPIEFARTEDVNCVECHGENDRPVCHCATQNKTMMVCNIADGKCSVTITTPHEERTVLLDAEKAFLEPELMAKLTSVARANAHEPVRVDRGTYMSEMHTDRDYLIKPGDRMVELRLGYAHHHRGEACTLRMTVHDDFVKKYASNLRFCSDQYVNSLNYSSFLLVSPNVQCDAPILIPAGTLVGVATTKLESADEAAGSMTIDQATPIVLRTYADPPASPLKWVKSDRTAIGITTVNDLPLVADRCLTAQDLVHKLRTTLEISAEEWVQLKPVGLHGVTLRMSHYLVDDNGDIYRPSEEMSFQDGGRPRTREDLHELGFTLEKAIDPSGTKDASGNYPPLPDDLKTRLYAIALRWYCVWSRDAKTPELSRLIVIDIPTGESAPIAQRPYPVPFKYLDAVRKEVQKLLDGGLIEPCISSWASPILVRLKKDSTPEEVRLKIIVDYRRLNEVTIPDAAGLGNQEEILHGFGGGQRYCGIVDAAGGFYQFLVNPKHRFKTAFCLPTSMGGTSFQWRVAPYGLTRNPAGYSRGMMYALKGLADCEFADGTGGASSWIDDVSMHADCFNVFATLFETVLQRIAFAGMSLKASKCFLLHQRLEVLGYFVTPDGLVMQDDKLEDFRRLCKDGKPVGPSNIKEVRTFLGAVQFYRRFVPRLALLSAPMNALLKNYPDGDARMQKGTPEHEEMMKGVQQSYEAILMFLQSSNVVSAPDLQDPLAEFVICPDACDIAVGGVLLQWQWPVPRERGPGPPAGVPLRAGKGTDPLTQSWRLTAGWKLRTIEFYSKTLDSAQQNYPTFDKEGAAILLCIRKWAQLITGHPTTVYTDSSVAATMLTKHLGPPRLQRWGMELGTFLPYLKIQHRRGVDNGMADFLSRFPTFEKYVGSPKDVVHLPDEDFADVVEVPLFTHKLVSENDNLIRNWRYTLVEAKEPKQAEIIWQGQVDILLLATTESGSLIRNAFLEGLVSEVKKCVTLQDFWREQRDFTRELDDWQQYVDIFHTTHGRLPIVFDLYCGEGGYSRGARAAGCECHGFDISTACRTRYESEPTEPATPSCMTFRSADVNSPLFWNALVSGELDGTKLPRPDFIHASPPCAAYVSFASIRHPEADGRPPGDVNRINDLICRFRVLEQSYKAKDGRPLIWQIENVPESKKYVTEPIESVELLCGTMMGHQLFRHRVIYSNYPLVTPKRHDHNGKNLSGCGARGDTVYNTRYSGTPAPNLYGIYSRPYKVRGNADEWHGALGALPGTYSSRGISGCLPTGYGRLTASQMVAHSLHQEYGCPVWPSHEVTSVERLCLERWASMGYQPLRAMQAGTAPSNEVFSQDCAEVAIERLEPEGLTGWCLPDEPFRNAFTISQQEQRQDPDLAAISRTLENSVEKSHSTHNTLHGNYLVRDGLLYRKDYSSSEQRCLLCVPIKLRSALMYHYHYAHHAGGEVLSSQLLRSFWWSGLHKDCADFVAACSICGPIKSGGMQSVPTQPIPSPSQPFSVIHVDHKGPLPLQAGSKNSYILVVVCALTRFCNFLPCQGTTALETFRLLVSRVFCVFGTPAVIVSDNGPAFRNDLAVCASKYFGYRHIHTLPYNPQANGAAEAAVKRIKLLLDRQTKDYVDWEKLLPLSQHMLNTTVHTSIGLTPYQALFGREPIGLEQLENPALYPVGDGEQFLLSLRQHMLHLHRSIREASDHIKRARADKSNTSSGTDFTNAHKGTVLPSTPGHDRYVWLLYGSKENAQYIRKHGHGAPWRHKYKVLEVRPHAVRLEVPKDGSVPRVLEWQCMRRVAVAHPSEHGPTGMEPYMTEYGYTSDRPQPIVARSPDGEAVVPDDTTLYEIEKIIRAERIGNRYKLWIKWLGYDTVTPRWRHELVTEITDPNLLNDIERSVVEARERHRAECGHLSDDEDSPDERPSPSVTLIPPPVVLPPILGVDNNLPIGKRLPSRNRSRPETYQPALLIELYTKVGEFLNTSAYSSLCSFLAARDDSVLRL